VDAAAVLAGQHRAATAPAAVVAPSVDQTDPVEGEQLKGAAVEARPARPAPTAAHRPDRLPDRRPNLVVVKVTDEEGQNP